MLYEFLTGQRPFTGSAQMLICDHLTAPPPPFFVKNQHNDVPPEVERVVLRCLAKDADDRPQSARALADEFLQAVQTASTRPGGRGAAIPTRVPYGNYNAPTQRFGEAQGHGASVGRPDYPPTSPTRPPDRSRDSFEGVADAGMQEFAAPAPKGDPRARRRALVVAGAVALAAVAIVALVLIAAKLMNRTGKEIVREKGGSVPPVTRKYEPSPPARHKISEWSAAGFMPDVEKGTNAKGWPISVRHLDPATSQNLTSSLSGDGHYLPDGYRAEGTRLASDDWPLFLVREKDEARFVRIPGGTFMMGCLDGTCTGPTDPAFPPHKVALSGYYIQINEVTDGEVLRYSKDFSGQFKSRKWDEDHRNLRLVLGSDSACSNYPATSMSHKQAEHFAAHYANGKLPTEAQWEFAARSRSEKGNLYPWSWQKPAEVTRINGMKLKERGNIDRAGERQIDTQPVGSYPSTDMTEQGLFDMAGNLREWCRDIYDRYPEGEERNPEGPKRAGDGTDGFVIRGGSYKTDTVANVQTTFRDQFSEGGVVPDIGFRVVLETPDSPGKAAAIPAPERR
jgi:serine/threonine-protein kinase